MYKGVMCMICNDLRTTRLKHALCYIVHLDLINYSRAIYNK